MSDLKLRMTLDGTPETLSKFNAAVQKFVAGGARAEKSWERVNKSLEGTKRLLEAVGVAVTASAIAEFTKETLELTLEQKDLAETIGTTVGHMSALTAAAKIAKVDTGTLTQGLGELGKRIDELKAGVPAMTAAFGRLGLTAKSFPSDDIADAADVVSRALERVRDGYTKGAIAQGIMGRSGRQLIPVLAQIGRMGGLAGVTAFARRTGFFVDEATVITMRELAVATRQFELVQRGVAVQFLEGFAPQAIELMRQLTDEIDPRGVSAMEAFGGAVGKWFRILVAEVRSAYTVLGAFFQWLKKERDVVLDRGAPKQGDFRVPVNPGDPNGPTIIDFGAFKKAHDEWLKNARQSRADIIDEALVRADVLMGQADNENSIKAQGLRRAQALDDEAYTAGEKSLAGYLAARNARIDTEVELEVAARRRQFETFAAGPQTAAAKSSMEQLRKEIELLQREGALRKEADAPARRRAGRPLAQDTSGSGAERSAAEAELRAVVAGNNRIAEAFATAYAEGRASLEQYLQARQRANENNLVAELSLLERRRELASKISDPEARAVALREIAADQEKAVADAAADSSRIQADALREKVALEKTIVEFEAKRRSEEAGQHEARMREIGDETEAFRRALVGQGSSQAQAQQRAAAFRTNQEGRENFRNTIDEAKRQLEAYQQLREVVAAQVSSHQLTEAQGLERLRDLDAARLPGIMALAEQLRSLAAALGPEAQAAVEKYIGDIANLQAKSRELSDDIRNGLAGALADAFSTGANEAKTFSGYLQSLGLQIAQMVQRLVALKAAQSLVGWIWPGGGGGGVGKADGGLLRGPGGPTGDQIPVMASDREWIAPAWLTGKPGALGFFEGLRTGRISTDVLRGFGPMAAVRPVRGHRYAEGGMVLRGGSGGEGGRVEGYVGVGLEGPGMEALILRTLASKPGQAVMLKNASANRRAFGTALRG